MKKQGALTLLIATTLLAPSGAKSPQPGPDTGSITGDVVVAVNTWTAVARPTTSSSSTLPPCRSHPMGGWTTSSGCKRPRSPGPSITS